MNEKTGWGAAAVCFAIGLGFFLFQLLSPDPDAKPEEPVRQDQKYDTTYIIYPTGDAEVLAPMWEFYGGNGWYVVTYFHLPKSPVYGKDSCCFDGEPRGFPYDLGDSSVIVIDSVSIRRAHASRMPLTVHPIIGGP